MKAPLNKYERDELENMADDLEEVVSLLKQVYSSTENETVKDMVSNEQDGVLDYAEGELKSIKKRLNDNEMLYGEG